MTSSRNGISVPITDTPSASSRLRVLESNSNGNVHAGATTSQNSVANPKPHSSVVKAS